MQIAINVNDEVIASKILNYLKSFKKNISVDMFEENESFHTYMQSKQFQQDRNSLHETLHNINTKKTTLSELDNTFWEDMDKTIESA